MNNLSPNSNGTACICPDNTFQIVNSACVCPSGTLQQPSGSSQTCIPCSVQYCATCPSLATCSACNPTFTLNNSTNCGCATGLTLFNATCYTCTGAQYCVTCSNTNYCSTCQTGFAAVNGTCVCPTGTTFFNNSCVPCNITGCTLCQTNNVCSTCAALYTLNGNVCLTCAISGCQSCYLNNFCNNCTSGLVPNSLGNLCINCSLPNCV